MTIQSTEPDWPSVPIDTLRANTFTFGVKSQTNLALAHPVFATTIRVAHFFTLMDWTVFETLRSKERQQELFDSGQSRTLNSNHLMQPSGYAHAADLVPYFDGKMQWDVGACLLICRAMVVASTLTQVNIRWGGSWTLLRPDFNPRAEMEAYKARKGDDAFVDAVHYELV